jgi:hypothetical protein
VRTRRHEAQELGVGRFEPGGDAEEPFRTDDLRDAYAEAIRQLETMTDGADLGRRCSEIAASTDGDRRVDRVLFSVR